MKDKPQKQQPQFYNTATAADILGVDVKTVRNWIAEGRFPGAFKVGDGLTSSFAIPAQEVDDYKKEREQSVN